jgi:enoyl-CoA hydratase/carnithine racemase
LNNPSKGNALNEEMVIDLARVCEWLAGPEGASVRVVILRGEGKSWCTGMDLKQRSKEESAKMAAAAVAAFRGWASLPQVRIAAVHGPVVGGGNGLACACDFIVATERSYFLYSEVRRGIVPAIISVFCVPRLGPTLAKSLLTTGVPLTASHALAVGLVWSVETSAVAVERRCLDIAATCLQAAPGARQATANLIDIVATSTTDDALAAARSTFQRAMASDEAKYGIGSFLRKQKPDWDAFAARQRAKL